MDYYKKNKGKKQNKGRDSSRKSNKYTDRSDMSPLNTDRRQQESDAKNCLLDLQDNEDEMLDPAWNDPYSRLYVKEIVEPEQASKQMRPKTAVDKRRDFKMVGNITRKTALEKDEKGQTMPKDRNNYIPKSTKNRKTSSEEEIIQQDEVVSARFLNLKEHNMNKDYKRSVTVENEEQSSFFPFVKKTPKQMEIEIENFDDGHKIFKLRPKTAVSSFRKDISYVHEKSTLDASKTPPAKDFNDQYKKNIQMMHKNKLNQKLHVNIYSFESKNYVGNGSDKKVMENSTDGDNYKNDNNLNKQKGYTMSECFKENVYDDSHIINNNERPKHGTNISNILRDINESNALLLQNSKNQYDRRKSNSCAIDVNQINAINHGRVSGLIPNPNNNSKISRINNEMISKYTNSGRFNAVKQDNQLVEQSPNSQKIKLKKAITQYNYQNSVSENTRPKHKRKSFSHSDNNISAHETNFNSAKETKNDKVNF